MTLVSDEEKPAFARLARYSGVSRIRAFFDPWLGFALHDDTSGSHLLNWRTGAVTDLQSHPDTEVMVFADTTVAMTDTSTGLCDRDGYRPISYSYPHAVQHSLDAATFH